MLPNGIDLQRPAGPPSHANEVTVYPDHMTHERRCRKESTDADVETRKQYAQTHAQAGRGGPAEHEPKRRAKGGAEAPGESRTGRPRRARAKATDSPGTTGSVTATPNGLLCDGRRSRGSQR